MDYSEHDFQEQKELPKGPYSYYQPPKRQPKPDQSPALASASFIMGIMALVFMSSGCFFIFFALGILFALLSRGSGSFLPKARTGLALCTGAFLIGTVSLAISLAALFQSGNGSMLQQFQNYYEYYMNQDALTSSSSEDVI